MSSVPFHITYDVAWDLGVPLWDGCSDPKTLGRVIFKELIDFQPKSVRTHWLVARRWDEPSVLQQESSVATLITLSGSAVRRSQLLSIVTLSVGFGLLCRYAAASVASVACCLVAVQRGQAKGKYSKL